MNDYKTWVERLDMQSHPEGGYYKETYRAQEGIIKSALPERFSGDTSFSTAIYFLLYDEVFSAFHRIASDEMWHYYQGDAPLEILEINPKGQLLIHHLGADWDAGERFQVVIGAGSWFASRVKGGKGFALVGCTVAPGFAFEDFVLASRSDLIVEYPQHEALIKGLTTE